MVDSEKIIIYARDKKQKDKRENIIKKYGCTYSLKFANFPDIIGYSFIVTLPKDDEIFNKFKEEVLNG